MTASVSWNYMNEIGSKPMMEFKSEFTADADAAFDDFCRKYLNSSNGFFTIDQNYDTFTSITNTVTGGCAKSTAATAPVSSTTFRNTHTVNGLKHGHQPSVQKQIKEQQVVLPQKLPSTNKKVSMPTQSGQKMYTKVLKIRNVNVSNGMSTEPPPPPLPPPPPVIAGSTIGSAARRKSITPVDFTKFSAAMTNRILNNATPTPVKADNVRQKYADASKKSKNQQYNPSHYLNRPKTCTPFDTSPPKQTANRLETAIKIFKNELSLLRPYEPTESQKPPPCDDRYIKSNIEFYDAQRLIAEVINSSAQQHKQHTSKTQKVVKPTIYENYKYSSSKNAKSNNESTPRKVKNQQVYATAAQPPQRSCVTPVPNDEHHIYYSLADYNNYYYENVTVAEESAPIVAESKRVVDELTGTHMSNIFLDSNLCHSDESYSGIVEIPKKNHFREEFFSRNAVRASKQSSSSTENDNLDDYPTTTTTTTTTTSDYNQNTTDYSTTDYTYDYSGPYSTYQDYNNTYNTSGYADYATYGKANGGYVTNENVYVVNSPTGNNYTMAVCNRNSYYADASDSLYMNGYSNYASLSSAATANGGHNHCVSNVANSVICENEEMMVVQKTSTVEKDYLSPYIVIPSNESVVKPDGWLGLKVFACGMNKKGKLPIPKANFFIEKGDFGDDAGFWSENAVGDAIGIADGASGNIMLGFDPGDFSRNLMRSCAEFFYRENRMSDAKSLLLKAYDVVQDKTCYGSSTACVLTLDHRNNHMTIANVGDSGYLLFRNGKIIRRSVPQRITYDCPKQLDSYPWKEASRKMGVNYTDILGNDIYLEEIKAIKDDLIILSSDGLFDNLDDHEIEEICKKSKTVIDAAENLVFHSVKYYRKPDDILVLIGKVVDNKQSTNQQKYSRAA